MGSNAFERAAQLTYAAGECILEIGAERGEGSTSYLAGLASRMSVPFFTIDPDPQAAQRCRFPVGDNHFLLGKAEDLLTAWDGPRPRFTWADGWDWPYSWHLPGAADQPMHEENRARYAAWGEDISRELSMCSHLEIAQLLHGMTRPGDVVVFDDTWYRPRDSQWQGKGGTAVPWLAAHGWLITEHTEHEETSFASVAMEREK